jgi:cysteinyl-tRNA synthetase
MTDLIIYDTRSQQKRQFIPLNSHNIGIYVCGITVYDYCHIGHARTFIAFDVIVRYLKHKYGAQNVKFVRNITDIDDKIIKRAQENNEPYTKLTARFIQAMHEDADNLGLLSPDAEPRATEYMPAMIKLIQQILLKQHAYVAANGDVYYKVRSFPAYGSLAKRNLDDLACGARVEVNEEKLDPLDFVLWKAAKPGEPQWDSPWGPGRPGWHLECSAMSMDLLGETFDLHGGGFDLIFPHHENECAQSTAATGKEFVKSWLHVGFLQIAKEKMSKSLNNFVTIREVLQQVHAEELRYFMLSGHYRSALEYSLDLIQQAKQPLERLYTAIDSFAIAGVAAAKDTEYGERFMRAMDDDFNTPEALAVLFDLVKEINKTNDLQQAAALVALLKELGSILGLLQRDAATVLGKVELTALDQHVQDLISARNAARSSKNWAEADRIRAELSALGVAIDDTASGSTVKKL